MLIIGSGKDDTIRVWGVGFIQLLLLFFLNTGSLRPCSCLSENTIYGGKYAGVRPTGKSWSILVIHLFLV